MKFLLLSLLLLAGPHARASESPAPARPYPLWDGQETVAEYAQRVNLPPTQTLDLGNGVKLELVLIPAGQFIMGTPEPETPTETVAVGQAILGLGGTMALGLLFVILFQAIRKRQRPNFSLRWLLLFVFALSIGLYGGVRWWKTVEAWREYEAAQARYYSANSGERSAHLVTLTQPFFIGKYVVTQEQYKQVTRADPSQSKGKDNPVESVNWDDAQAFCKKLAEYTKQTVRLPTEAEWEFSCRAGTTTNFHSGDAEADLARAGWYSANCKSTMHPVGLKEPNSFGLYDMHGNVWQWCEDWYGEDYYGKSVAENPQGPSQGTDRVLRGGSWYNFSKICRSAYRFSNSPINLVYNFGFRVVVPGSKTP